MSKSNEYPIKVHFSNEMMVNYVPLNYFIMWDVSSGMQLIAKDSTWRDLKCVNCDSFGYTFVPMEI